MEHTNVTHTPQTHNNEKVLHSSHGSRTEASLCDAVYCHTQDTEKEIDPKASLKTVYNFYYYFHMLNSGIGCKFTSQFFGNRKIFANQLTLPSVEFIPHVLCLPIEALTVSLSLCIIFNLYHTIHYS